MYVSFASFASLILDLTLKGPKVITPQGSNNPTENYLGILMREASVAQII